MLRSLTRGGGTVFAAFLPIDFDNHDRVSKETKTARDFTNRPPDTETGKDRLFMMFSLDEFGSISSELNSIYQAAFIGFLGGACYGGFIKSKIAYLDFMENNQATAFRSHFDAKKKLQDKVTLSFAKGAFRWGWRLSLFTASYVGIVTTISVYRGKSSIYEYLSAGGITGSLYKINMGLRGMAVGGLLGGGLGGVAGIMSLLLLRISGTSMEEVRYWQYKWRLNRDEAIRESAKKQVLEPKDDLLEHHEEHLGGAHISLDSLDVKAEPRAPTKTATK